MQGNDSYPFLRWGVISISVEPTKGVFLRSGFVITAKARNHWSQFAAEETWTLVDNEVGLLDCL